MIVPVLMTCENGDAAVMGGTNTMSPDIAAMSSVTLESHNVHIPVHISAADDWDAIFLDHSVWNDQMQMRMQG